MDGAFAEINALRKCVESSAEWDSAGSEDLLHFYILRAAQNVGRFEPFTPAETHLNAFLRERMAGKRLCDYAWRIFAASRTP